MDADELRRREPKRRVAHRAADEYYIAGRGTRAADGHTGGHRAKQRRGQHCGPWRRNTIATRQMDPERVLICPQSTRKRFEPVIPGSARQRYIKRVSNWIGPHRR